jgi:hypothetical protein
VVAKPDRRRQDKGQSLSLNREIHGPNLSRALLRGGYILTGLWLAMAAYGQAAFGFFNPGSPTPLYYGQNAGPGIWGRALVGLTNDSLRPLGLPAQHRAKRYYRAAADLRPILFLLHLCPGANGRLGWNYLGN